MREKGDEVKGNDGAITHSSNKENNEDEDEMNIPILVGDLVFLHLGTALHFFINNSVLFQYKNKLLQHNFMRCEIEYWG